MHRIALTLAAWGLIVGCAGCFGPPNLPAELDIVLAEKQKVATSAGGGAAILAGQSWELFRKEDPNAAENAAITPGPYGGFLGGNFFERLEPGARMFRIVFDAQGAVVGIEDNAFYLPDLTGTTIIVDGQFHPARLPGVTAAAVGFCAAIGDQVGVALPVDVRFFGIPVGTATAYAWGGVVEDRIDGVYGYTSDFAPITRLFLGSGGDQFPAFAERVLP